MQSSPDSPQFADKTARVTTLEKLANIVVTQLCELAGTGSHRPRLQDFANAAYVAARWLEIPHGESFGRAVIDRLVTDRLLCTTLGDMYLYLTHYPIAASNRDGPSFPTGVPVIVDSPTTAHLIGAVARAIQDAALLSRFRHNLAFIKRDGLAAFLIHHGENQLHFSAVVVDWDQGCIRSIDSICPLPIDLQQQFTSMLWLFNLDPPTVWQDCVYYEQPSLSTDCLLYAILAAEAEMACKFPNHQFPMLAENQLFSDQVDDEVRRTWFLNHLITQTLKHGSCARYLLPMLPIMDKIFDVKHKDVVDFRFDDD